MSAALLPIVNTINTYLSDYILFFLLIAVGLWYSIKTRFVQVRCFGEGMRKVFGNLSLNGKKQDTADRYVFWLRNEGGPNFCGKTQSAVRYRNHKFLQNMPFEQAQLFDLDSDPLEASPLELKGPAYRDLHRALTDHYRKWGAVPCQPPTQTKEQ